MVLCRLAGGVGRGGDLAGAIGGRDGQVAGSRLTLAGDLGNGLNAKLGLRLRQRSQVYQGKLHRFIVSFHFTAKR